MRVRFRFTVVWVATTAAGMAISWAGVGHALRGTTLQAPDLAANVPVQRGRPPTPPAGPSGASPTVSSSAPHRTVAPSTSPSASARTSAPASPTSAPSTDAGAGKVRTYVVKHGRVVLSLTSSSARLVSAVPDSGFEVKTWRKSTWLRVDLTDGEHGSAVFATWNGHPTLVQVYEY
ncbi:hypothetical protein [Actinomadura violacea]|uniref:Secreted protein n=1 Tax=Actinomadura violacea TaxID=2819934 RepID=A0ABS3RPE4_9ACTN|nr:hypothetical protein [Actinomadura violacea]MBO2457929.1 hypothetical protein [Actinomadura violacea]